MKGLLKEARDLLVMCTLIDKSGQCQDMVNKIDKALKEQDSPFCTCGTRSNELDVNGRCPTCGKKLQLVVKRIQ